MERPDKLQIARDEIAEGIDILAVMFIDQDTDLFWKIQAKIDAKIQTMEHMDRAIERTMRGKSNATN